MSKNRKIYVYMVLFVVFITQLCFSKPAIAQTALDLQKSDTQDVQNARTLTVEETTALAQADEVLEVQDAQAEAEAAYIEPKIVYRSTLTSDGEIVDSFTENTQRSDFENKVISYCMDRITVHSEPDPKSQVVGCMYSRSQADILEKGDVWTKISSGDVVGYVKNTYLLFGEEADKVAPLIGKKTTVVDADTLSVYSAADADSDVIAVFSAGDVINAYEEIGEWVLVECESGYGYVYESGIISTYDLATAWTIEEENAYLAEQARIEAERIAAERAAAAKLAMAQSTPVAATTNAAMSVSDSELYLLACIIDWESGWEPYEGKLAVANVVLNRVRSSRFKQNTITDVIYAPGQFSGVTDGNGNPSERFSALLARGPRLDECYTAAREALAGVNNIGDYLFFASVKKANFARYTQYTVINNHCFYSY